MEAAEKKLNAVPLSNSQKNPIATKIVPQIKIPPIVGVPAFCPCIFENKGVEPSLRICLPNLFYV